MRDMPVAKSDLPFKPDANASLIETKAVMGDLIEWALGQRIGQLKAAGITSSDLMRLGCLAVNLQKGQDGFANPVES